MKSKPEDFRSLKEGFANIIFDGQIDALEAEDEGETQLFSASEFRCHYLIPTTLEL